MEQRALIYAAERVRTEGTSLRKTRGHRISTGRINGNEHRSVPSVPAKGMNRAIKQAFMRDWAALGGEDLQGAELYLTSI